MGPFSCRTCPDLMLVLVMEFGCMGMGMRLWIMGMLVTVFFRDFSVMMIVMTIVMTVTVFVGFLYVDMRMFMLLDRKSVV